MVACQSCQVPVTHDDLQANRTSAANFSASGLKRQDNDLIILRDTQVATKFKHVFEARFASGITLPATAVR